MLSQINLAPCNPHAVKRHTNKVMVLERIDATLRRLGTATTDDLAAACGISNKSVTRYMDELRALGEVKHGEPRRKSNRGRYPARTWELGFDPTYRPGYEEEKPEPPPFVAFRDPLVAALFGQPRASTSLGLGG